MPNLTDPVYRLRCSGTALSVLHSTVGFTKDHEIWELLKKQCIVSDSPSDKECELRYITIIRGIRNNKVLCTMVDRVTGNCLFVTHENPRDVQASFMDMLLMNAFKAYMTAVHIIGKREEFNPLLAKSEPIPLGYLYDGHTNYIVTELAIDDEVFETCENSNYLNYGLNVKPMSINGYSPSTELEKALWKEIAITK